LIRLGNGVLFESSGRKFRFDPKRIMPDEICMISHAHSDHLPSSLRIPRAICTPITRDFVEIRKKKRLEIAEDACVEILDAGHIPGSAMFLVSGDKKVLYTGDFCTRDKPHLKGARPWKCDVLIVEATYGKPRYVFPDHKEVMAVVKDWLSDLVKEGGSAVLFAYPLGKSQELSMALRNLPLFLNPVIAENNRVLLRHGYQISDRPVEENVPARPFIYITSGFSRDRARVEKMVRYGAKTAAFSGWALDRVFLSDSGVDEAFPVSDHCGYDELLKFVEQCDPDLVFTTHGFTRELAQKIRKELGIDAQPLVARQRTLDHFC